MAIQSQLTLTEQDAQLLSELRRCKLCEWGCGVDRLGGEKGFCGLGIPMLASSCLHPAPPASYTGFMLGCNFRCLGCQNWTISMYPENSQSKFIEGYRSPKDYALQALANLESPQAKLIGADRIFFSGGEPTCSLPWIEGVIQEARKIHPGTKLNFDTNGYMTPQSLERIIAISDSITYDIKAYTQSGFEFLTGADVEPVLRNAEYIAKHAPQKLYEFRILVIPGFEREIPQLCEFIASLDPQLPVCFLAFRPNFAMDFWQGASSKLMEWCIQEAKKHGLSKVHWSGTTGISGIIGKPGFQLRRGCISKERSCRKCSRIFRCELKKYVPFRIT